MPRFPPLLFSFLFLSFFFFYFGFTIELGAAIGAIRERGGTPGENIQRSGWDPGGRGYGGHLSLGCLQQGLQLKVPLREREDGSCCCIFWGPGFPRKGL